MPTSPSPTPRSPAASTQAVIDVFAPARPDPLRDRDVAPAGAGQADTAPVMRPSVFADRPITAPLHPPLPARFRVRGVRWIASLAGVLAAGGAVATLGGGTDQERQRTIASHPSQPMVEAAPVQPAAPIEPAAVLVPWKPLAQGHADKPNSSPRTRPTRSRRDHAQLPDPSAPSSPAPAAAAAAPAPDVTPSPSSASGTPAGSVPPTRRAPALPAPVPPGSPPEFL